MVLMYNFNEKFPNPRVYLAKINTGMLVYYVRF